MISAIIGSFFLTAQTPIAPVDPDANWKTKKTQHFWIHYPESHTHVADKMVEIVEPVHERLTKKMSWKLSSSITHLVLLQDTQANGFSTPLPYNSMYLNIAPPTEGSSLDNYDDWLTTLFTHEYTHTLHIDMVGGINRVLRFLFGRFWVPNAAQPQWLIEGLAIYNESTETTGGRGKSSFIDMFMRTVAIQDKFIPISRATYWNHKYPYGNAAYWYGIGFHDFLARKFGEKALFEFARKNSRWPIVGYFNFKTKEIFGTSFARLWNEWRLEEQRKWRGSLGKYQSSYRGKALGEDIKLSGQGVWDPNKDVIYTPLTEKGRTRLVELSFDEKGEPKEKLITKGISAKRLSFHDGNLYYARGSNEDRFEKTVDITRYNIEKEEAQSITAGLKARDPVAGDDYIYAVNVVAMKSSIIRAKNIPWKVVDEDPDKKVTIDKIETIYQAPDFGTISSLTLSPDQNFLAFSMFVENGWRDLYVMNLKTNKVRRLTQDEYLDYFPRFSEDGQYIYFSSDRELGRSGEKVFNIYALHLKSNRLLQVTDTWTGAFWPSIKDTKVFLGHFDHEGFKAHLTNWELPQKINDATAPKLEKQALTVRQPSILDTPTQNTSVKTEDYDSGYTLLPHYLAPIWLVTEDDAAIGAFTGSNDPLGFHRWTAFGAYLTEPNRPLGSLNYSYLGFAPVTLFFSGSAGITDYGNILLTTDGNNNLFFNDYFERRYQASLGYSIKPFMSTPIYWSQYFFFADRRSLLSTPTGLVTGATNVPANTQFVPEKGQLLGTGGSISWGTGIQRSFYDLAPASGTNVQFSWQYAPEISVADFKQLNTTLGIKSYFELARKHTLATRLIAGNQWFDPLYQRTFQLGGSFGTSPFSSINRRSYALRGIPFGRFAGEGLLLANLEYRFPLWDMIPGWGTAPIWIKNLHGALFTDAGQVFQLQDERTFVEILNRNVNQADPLAGDDLRKPDYDRITMTVGAELRADISNLYGPPLTYRLGYGRAVYFLGEYAFDEEIDQIYFQVGQSF